MDLKTLVLVLSVFLAISFILLNYILRKIDLYDGYINKVNSRLTSISNTSNFSIEASGASLQFMYKYGDQSDVEKVEKILKKYKRKKC